MIVWKFFTITPTASKSPVDCVSSILLTLVSPYIAATFGSRKKLYITSHRSNSWDAAGCVRTRSDPDHNHQMHSMIEALYGENVLSQFILNQLLESSFVATHGTGAFRTTEKWYATFKCRHHVMCPKSRPSAPVHPVCLVEQLEIVLAESVAELQRALNAVYEYCSSFKLTANTTKRRVMVFSNDRIRILFFNDDKPEVVSEYQYLDFVLNYNGSFIKAITNRQETPSKHSSAHLWRRAPHSSQQTSLCELFTKTILPVPTYDCEIWVFSDLEQLDIFHRKFLQPLLKVSKSTPNCMLYGETGQYKIQKFVEKQILCFWYRLINGKESKILLMMYKLIYAMHINRTHEYRSAWNEKIENCLNRLGFGDIWIAQENSNLGLAAFEALVSSRSSDINEQEWRNMVYENSACNNYRIF